MFRIYFLFPLLIHICICIIFCSPPGSPTTVGFFPAASSLSSPAGLVRMPGLAYNGSGVKELINAVQGYQVRTSSLPLHPIHLITYICSTRTCSHAPSVLFYSNLLRRWVCIVRYPLRLLQAIKLVHPVYSPWFVTRALQLALTWSGRAQVLLLRPGKKWRIPGTRRKHGMMSGSFCFRQASIRV